MNEWVNESLFEQGLHATGFGALPLMGSFSWANRAAEQEQQCHSDKKRVQALGKSRGASGSHAMVGVSCFSEEHIPEHIYNVCDIENSYKYITSCLSFKSTMGSNVIL